MVQKEKHASHLGGFIYIIICNEFCKIGIAKNPDGRFQTVQANCPYEMRFVIFKVPSAESRFAAELWAQFYLKEFWTGRGEWFEIPFRKAASAVKKAIRLNDKKAPPWFVLREQKQATGAAVMKRLSKSLAQDKRDWWKDPKNRARQSQHSKDLWKKDWYRSIFQTNEFRAKLSKATGDANRKRRKS